MKTRILLADDHELVRTGVRRLLNGRTKWRVCGEARDGKELIAKARTLKPEILIVDISMPGADGLEAIREIKGFLPESRILVLTMHEPDELLRLALDAGAHGYVMKSDAARELLAALSAMSEQKPYFSSSTMEAMKSLVTADGSYDEEGDERKSLTPRELQVTNLLGQGKSNKEVAESLNISARTAEVHRRNIMHKLGLHSITELVRFAIRKGMVQA